MGIGKMRKGWNFQIHLQYFHHDIYKWKIKDSNQIKKLHSVTSLSLAFFPHVDDRINGLESMFYGVLQFAWLLLTFTFYVSLWILLSLRDMHTRMHTLSLFLSLSLSFPHNANLYITISIATFHIRIQSIQAIDILSTYSSSSQSTNQSQLNQSNPINQSINLQTFLDSENIIKWIDIPQVPSTPVPGDLHVPVLLCSSIYVSHIMSFCFLILVRRRSTSL